MQIVSKPGAVHLVPLDGDRVGFVQYIGQDDTVGFCVLKVFIKSYGARTLPELEQVADGDYYYIHTRKRISNKKWRSVGELPLPADDNMPCFAYSSCGKWVYWHFNGPVSIAADLPESYVDASLGAVFDSRDVGSFMSSGIVPAKGVSGRRLRRRKNIMMNYSSRDKYDSRQYNINGLIDISVGVIFLIVCWIICKDNQFGLYLLIGVPFMLIIAWEYFKKAVHLPASNPDLVPGDVFELPLSSSEKVYLQYISDGWTSDVSRTVRIFKRRYPLQEFPLVEEVVNDDVLMYANTSMLDADSGSCCRIGNVKKLGPKFSERFAAASWDGWCVWRLSGDTAKKYRRLPKRYYGAWDGNEYDEKAIVHHILNPGEDITLPSPEDDFVIF